MDEDPGEVTILLTKLKQGNQEAATELLALVYPELRRLASAYMRGERGSHTLQPTALVHEAYLRLVQTGEVDWRNRAHFIAFAANLMRRILVDYARARNAEKRGGPRQRVELREELAAATDVEATELLDLDAALDRLEQMDQRISRVVELRYFGGLTADETAEVLGVSTKTVKRDWSIARSWLKRELRQGGQNGGKGTMDAG